MIIEKFKYYFCGFVGLFAFVTAATAAVDHNTAAVIFSLFGTVVMYAFCMDSKAKIEDLKKKNQ